MEIQENLNSQTILTMEVSHFLTSDCNTQTNGTGHIPESNPCTYDESTKEARIYTGETQSRQ